MAYSENGSVLPVGASEVVAALTCGPELVELEELPLPLPPEVRAGFTPDPGIGSSGSSSQLDGSNESKVISHSSSPVSSKPALAEAVTLTVEPGAMSPSIE